MPARQSVLLHRHSRRSRPGTIRLCGPLVDWLDYNGYTMVTKVTREFTDQAGAASATKGSTDIELGS